MFEIDFLTYSHHSLQLVFSNDIDQIRNILM